MKFNYIIRPATQAEILRDSRKPFARSTAKHISKKAYRRKTRFGGDEKE